MRVNINETFPQWKKNMPPQVYADFKSILGEVFGLHVLWNEVREIRGNSSNLELVNRIATGFFSEALFTMSDAVILGTCRLADPAGQGSKENLSLPHLIKVIGESEREVDKILKAELDKNLARCKPDLDALQLHRNRRIAHNDRETRINPDAITPLGRVEQGNVEDVLNIYLEMLRMVEGHYWTSDPLTFDPLTVDPLEPPRLAGDAKQFMVSLKEAFPIGEE